MRQHTVSGGRPQFATRTRKTGNAPFLKGAIGIRIPLGRGEGVRQVTADAYGVSATPTLVLVGKDDKASGSRAGRVEAEVKMALSSGE